MLSSILEMQGLCQNIQESSSQGSCNWHPVNGNEIIGQAWFDDLDRIDQQEGAPHCLILDKGCYFVNSIF